MGKNLLVVDDIPEYLDVIEVILEDFNIIKARTMEEALNLLDNNDVEIAIVDVRLDENDCGNKDGLILLKKIKSEHPDIPVIMISAYKEFDYKGVAFQIGAEAFLEKPINPEKLKKLLMEFIK